MNRPPNWAVSRLFFLTLIFVVLAKAEDSDNSTQGDSDTDPLWKAYLECRPDLGEKVLICDPDKALQAYGVKKQIDDILWRMQSEVPCYCALERDCSRYDDFPIQSGVVAAFVAFAGCDLPDDVESITERIYNDARLSSSLSTPDPESDHSDDDVVDACDNGLLLVYAVETRSLFFYPGSVLSSVFDHLQTHKRRIEPQALIDYLERMLAILQSRPPESVPILQRSLVRAGWRSWEMVVGMIAALLIVSVTGAAIFAICLGVRGKSARGPYMDEREACRRYEKECEQWSKRARRLAKQRAKIMRAMQKPNWADKVEAARRRLERKSSSSMAALASAAESDATGPAGEQQRNPSFPCYVVSEPSSVYNTNRFYNWASFEDDETTRPVQTPVGTVRSDRHGPALPSLIPNGKRSRLPRRETQRCDFYFQDE